MNLWHLLRYGQSDHEFIRGRDALGRLTTRCTLCGFTRLVLCEEDANHRRGIAHQQVPDLGAIRTKAVSAGKVTKIRKAG